MKEDNKKNVYTQTSTVNPLYNSTHYCKQQNPLQGHFDLHEMALLSKYIFIITANSV